MSEPTPPPATPEIDPAAAAELAELKRIATELEEGSRVKNPAARRALAELAAISQLQLRSMHARRAANKLPAEEARTIPAVASGLKRALEALGHVASDNDNGEPASEGFKPPKSATTATPAKRAKRSKPEPTPKPSDGTPRS